MNTLVIDIGGTKFSMAIFEQDHIVRRESRATDRAGGRAWMLAQIANIACAWQRDLKLDSCGIGFGGPVDFASQRVFKSTHVGGWSDILCATSLPTRSKSPPSWITTPTSARSARPSTALAEATRRSST
jgi:predicted NBD/HSP70 family sugar kinase